MNKTRKLTQGAMFLAIVGAVMIIDRQLSFAFTELVVMAFSVVIVLYGAMYTFKDGIYLSLCLVALIILFGGVYTYVYGPISIIVGLVYSYFLSKDSSNKTLMLSSMITYTLSEFAATYAIYPLLGSSVASQIAAIEETLSQTNITQYFEMLGPLKDNLITIAFVASLVLLGIMEGLIIHLLSILLLKRFKIKDIKVTKLSDTKPNPILAYISIAAVFTSFFIKQDTNPTVMTIISSVSIVGSCILIYYGYIFVMSYISRRKGNTKPFLIMLLILFTIPTSLFVLLILGFLYASGPLYNKLQRKKEEKTLL